MTNSFYCAACAAKPILESGCEPPQRATSSQAVGRTLLRA